MVKCVLGATLTASSRGGTAKTYPVCMKYARYAVIRVELNIHDFGRKYNDRLFVIISTKFPSHLSPNQKGTL